MQIHERIYIVGSGDSGFGISHDLDCTVYLIDGDGEYALIDAGAGVEPESILHNIKAAGIHPAQISGIFLTHGHGDHSGGAFALSRACQAEVYALRETAEYVSEGNLKAIALEEAIRAGVYGKGYTFHACPVRPILEDTSVQVGDIRLNVYRMEGHCSGHACYEMIWQGKKIVFSGDIGNIDQPLIKDPADTEEADYVVMESTYGNRAHSTGRPDYVADLAKVLQETFDRGGNVVIPSFAVGRTQEMLYFLRQIKEEKRIDRFPNFTVYVDSPLAVEATDIFQRNVAECFDEEAMELVRKGINPIRFPGLRLSITSDESKAINFDDSPKVVISASGMCEAGRIRHHLKHNLWKPECTILFVGYQANGTLGRSLIEGAKEVKLFGEKIEVRADIRTLPGISGHADKDGLIRWIEGFRKKPEKIFVVHGESSICESFVSCLKEEHKMEAYAPYSGTCFDLLTGEAEYVAKAKPLKKKRAAQDIFDRLLAAGQRLMAVIRKNEGGANKDLGKFADQINSLCDKWDR